MKKINNKQVVVQKNNNISTKTKKRLIIGVSSSIILLVLILLGTLSLTSKAKSDSKKMIDSFYKFYESKDYKVICYYDSKKEDNEAYFELDYLLQLSKQYGIEYTEVDSSKISEKNNNKIKKLLGIEGINPTTVVVRNKKIVAQQEGFIESNKLVELLIDAKVLDEGSKLKSIDNLKFIDYNKFKEIVEDDDTNVVVVGQSACQYCNSVKPILNNISKAYKIDINYFNVNEESTDNLKEFFDKLPDMGYDDEKLKSDETFYMPTVLIIKDNKIISYLQNEHTLEEYIDYFKENNIIE